MYGSRVLCTFITVSPSKTSLLTTSIPYVFLAIQDLNSEPRPWRVTAGCGGWSQVIACRSLALSYGLDIVALWCLL
jgi:hypothetical protein